MDSHPLLSVKDLDILIRATGLTTHQIWTHIIGFILMGTPTDKDPDQQRYRLYHCWQAVVRLRADPNLPQLHLKKDWDWLSIDHMSLACALIGWTGTKAQLIQGLYDNNVELRDEMLLLHQVMKTTRFMLEHLAPSPRKTFTPQTWCWYIPTERPAFIWRIMDLRELPTAPWTLLEVLVQSVDTGFDYVNFHDGPSLVTKPTLYHAQFEMLITTPDKLAHITTDTGELDY